MAWYSRIVKTIGNIFGGGHGDEPRPSPRQPSYDETDYGGRIWEPTTIASGGYIHNDDIVNYTINTPQWDVAYPDGGDRDNIEKVHAFYETVFDNPGNEGRIRHDLVAYFIDWDDYTHEEAINAMREVVPY